MYITSFKTQNSQPRQSFKAVGVGVCSGLIKGAETKIKLYKLEPKDFNFLDKMADAIDIKRLEPQKANHQKITSWKRMIDEAVDYFKQRGTAFLASAQNYPCGIIFMEETPFNVLALHRLASWSIAPGRQVRKTGTALMHMANLEGLKKDVAYAKLTPLYNSPGPANLDEFYKKMGYEYNHRIHALTAEKVHLQEFSKLIAQKINFTPLENQKSENLFNTLRLDFFPQENPKKSMTNIFSFLNNQ